MSKIYTVVNRVVTSWTTTDGTEFTSQTNEVMSRSNLIYLYKIYETEEEARTIAEAPMSKGQITAMARIDADIKTKHDAFILKENTIAAAKMRHEEIRVRHEIKASVLKEFRIRTLSVSLPKLKKVMFSITGNKQFNKWSYNPTKDDDVFRFITVQQIDEVYEVLNFV